MVLFSRLVGVCKEEEILPQDATDFVLYVEAYLHALHDEEDERLFMMTLRLAETDTCTRFPTFHFTLH